MSVKVADKLTQFNNGTYYLMDSSAVEYVDKDGNTKSVKDVLDNGIGEGNTTDLTDLENRVTTNETNITDLQEQTSDLQEQIDNLDIPEDVDLTEINDKLTQLETNQINNSVLSYMSSTETTCKITPNGLDTFSKILISDLYGGCILITGSPVPDYKPYKVVRLSNGYWSSYSPSNNLGNKLKNVYYDGSFIYLELGNYTKLYIEGGFTNVEKIDSVPTEATELPILDLTQQTDLTGINTKLSQLEDKRVYNSLEELNTAKGLSISFTNGEDNTMKIIDALSPIETFADYFDNRINNNRFGIDTNTYGTDISLLTITKFNDNMTIIKAFMANGKFLVRRYINGALNDWQYDKTDLTDINTKLTQLENTINEVGGGGIYSSGEVEVGKWVDGQTLYRSTISDSTERTFSSGTMMLDLFTLSRNEYTVVKLDGTFRMCAATDNSGAHTVYALPYIDLETNRQVHLVYTTQDRVRLSGKNLKDYKLLGFDVSIYYYKK